MNQRNHHHVGVKQKQIDKGSVDIFKVTKVVRNDKNNCNKIKDKSEEDNKNLFSNEKSA